MITPRDGRSKHPLYRTWTKMKNRCYNINNDSYKYYGGRGIKVCDTWRNDFNEFLKDMGERPIKHTLDRIDVKGDYTSENCRWATNTAQHRNTTRNVINRIGKSELETIINLYKNEISMKKIAQKFGLHESFISGLVLGASLSNPIPKSYSFREIALVPQKNICKSRLDTSIKSEIVRGRWLDTPFIAANMSTVCNAQFCIKLNTLGSMGILHRAMSSKDLINETKILSENSELVAVSIGVAKDQFSLVKQLVTVGANIIVIDIANGYTNRAIELGRKIKKEYPVKLIIGNTTNVGMLYEVEDFADAIKIGIANGLACETKNTTAFTEGQFSTVLKFKTISKKLGLPVISDGGIREPADVVKAIAAGANSIMAGSIFAKCPESAAELVYINNIPKKVYAGMASRYVQDKWRGLKSGTCPEGNVKYLDLGEPVSNLIERYSGALRSGITYSGGNTLFDLQKNVEFINITPN